MQQQSLNGSMQSIPAATKPARTEAALRWQRTRDGCDSSELGAALPGAGEEGQLSQLTSGGSRRAARGLHENTARAPEAAQW
jgi:hypothetical protein